MFELEMENGEGLNGAMNNQTAYQNYSMQEYQCYLWKLNFSVHLERRKWVDLWIQMSRFVHATYMASFELL